LRIRLISLIIWILLFASASCLAQFEASGDASETISTFIGTQFYSRTLENGDMEETVRQLVFPLFASYLRPIGTEYLNVKFYGTMSRSGLDDGPELDNLYNAWLRGSYSLFRCRLITYVELALPAMGVEAENETAHLRNLLYSEPLTFGESRAAGGLDLDAGFIFAQPLGRLSLAVGAGYVLRGNYDRLAADESIASYKPGNALTSMAGAHFHTKIVSLRGGVSHLYYGKDAIDGNDAFENGSELTFSLATTFRPGPLTVTFLLADTIKGESQILENEAVTGNLFTNRLDWGISLAYSLLGDMLILKTETKMKRFYDDGEINTKSASLGGGFQLVISDNVELEVLASFTGGNVDDGETDFSGFSLGSIIKAGF